jgi:hypothetical protein
LTAPPPRKKAGESDHHNAPKPKKEAVDEEAAEEKAAAVAAPVAVATKHEKDFYPYILIGILLHFVISLFFCGNDAIVGTPFASGELGQITYLTIRSHFNSCRCRNCFVRCHGGYP